MRPSQLQRGHHGKVGQAQYPRHLRRRYRNVECWRLHARDEGPYAQHRPDREGRDPLHRSLRATELHRRSCRIHQGQLPVRTGMTTIGIPGSPRGIQKDDPTLAEVLKAAGYATGQFGKNHLGDRNEFLPTVHGFDEWVGNLYHLNAEEEPEELDYPGQKNPDYKKKFGPRGVLHTWATDKEDRTVDPKFGRVGKQKIKDTGPLTRKRMQTFDKEG